MTTKPKNDPARMLGVVALRQRLASFGKRFYVATLVVTGLCGLALLAERFLGLTTSGFALAPVALLLVPVLAAVAALCWHHRPSQVDAARAVDRTAGTKDLFLTYALLDTASGDYQPLVASAAEQRVPQVDPRAVVPWRWGARFGRAAAAIGLLLGGMFYLPQLDPFGKVAAAQEKEARRSQLAKDSQATQLRLADLKKGEETGRESEEVNRSINDLTNSFRAMKRQEPQPNLAKLNDHQKQIGAQWRKLGAEKLRTLLSQSDSFQDFGGQRQRKLDRWTKEMLKGSSQGLQQELNELQKELQALMDEQDPVRRAEAARQLKEQLRDLEQFASENVGSPELAAALRRAMRQLEAAERGDVTPREALESVAKSLDLSKLELQQIARSAQNMKSLEEALEAIQMAKQLNADERLDGEDCEACQSLGDYAELYALMINEQSEGQGMGQRGFGRGGEAPEDDSVASDFKSEQEKTAVQAGKLLLSLQTKGLSEPGEADKDYRQLMGTIKQGISEAITQEQVPPGYHEAIRGYFDSLEIEPDGSSPE